MCKIKNVVSKFRFLGDQYRIHVVEKNGLFFPVIEKKVFSFMSFSFWKEETNGKNQYFIDNKEATKLEKKGTLSVVKWMRSFAENRAMILNNKGFL